MSLIILMRLSHYWYAGLIPVELPYELSVSMSPGRRQRRRPLSPQRDGTIAFKPSLSISVRLPASVSASQR